jgi:hypothetical protein
MIEIILPTDIASATSVFENAFGDVGEFVESGKRITSCVGGTDQIDYLDPLENLDFVGKICSGILNMNPAILFVDFKQGDNAVNISILAVAFEGIVKQNTIGKAIERLIISMEEELGSKVNWQ